MVSALQSVHDFPVRDGYCLLFNSLISYRCLLPVSDLHEGRDSLLQYLSENGIQETGPFITVLHTGFVNEHSVMFDFEFMLPIPGKIPLQPGFSFVPKLMITNAVCMRHVGSFHHISGTYTALYEHIRAKGLLPITDIFHVDVADTGVAYRKDNPVMDVYIGTGKRLER
jgi:effector-binding domain-containing protein